MLRRIAIIVASGTGSRMGGEIPKQFLPLGGKPVLVHTLEKFLSLENCEIILALSGQEFWKPIAHRYLPGAPITVVRGGETRFHSVKNALDSIQGDENAVVAVHDGVRPFIPQNIIENCFSVAAQAGTAVTCVDSKDSVRLLSGTDNRAVDRRSVKLIQTPQAFSLPVLRRAYEAMYNENFTDDASVVEHSGHPIRLIEGSYSNIKITTPEDMALGELILAGFSEP